MIEQIGELSNYFGSPSRWELLCFFGELGRRTSHTVNLKRPSIKNEDANHGVWKLIERGVVVKMGQLKI